MIISDDVRSYTCTHPASTARIALAHCTLHTGTLSDIVSVSVYLAVVLN